MKKLFYIISLFFFFGCSQSPTILFDDIPKTYLMKKKFSDLPKWEEENHFIALDTFVNSCKVKRTKKIYENLCKEAKIAKDAKKFFELNFQPYKIYKDKSTSIGLLTGYYEAELKGSLKKTKRYKYPIYKTPNDLIVVDLGSIYPELKKYRLRGRIKGNKLVPYYKRKELNTHTIHSDILCYVDSKIDLFFLEIQGSGRVTFENGNSIFVGYANQNGHKYRAIGRYLIKIGALKRSEVSLESIKKYLKDNPSKVKEVLNYNNSVVYFAKKRKSATGSLGLELHAKRSVAVDRRYIPLGTLLYMNSFVDNQAFTQVVSAQDTGGAIKGSVRADLFLGYTQEAMRVAGELKSELNLWMLLPKNKEINNDK